MVMMTLTIDGRTVTVPEGTTVLDAALAAGIEVPRLCHHPELTPFGGCRLCLVEVNGQPGPVASCGLKASEGMVVITRGERLQAHRREMLDLILSDHPLRCSICEKAGACALQRYAYEFGLAESTYEREVGRTLYQDDNPFFVRDHQYCILCTRCVRVCDEVVGAEAIKIAERGFGSYVATQFDAPLADGPCTFCGNCVQVCPTAALMPVARRQKGREWDLIRTRTICPYCGTGCSVEVATTRGGEIVSVSGVPGSAVNGEFLCTKGRFGLEFAHHPDRLRRPLVRRDFAYAVGLTSDPPPADLGASPLGTASPPSATHVEVDWEVALGLVADRLTAIVRAAGPDAVAGIGSAQCTNEENYLFQKLMRGAIGTNNVDLCARL
jgi:predicted molibdopterin-dependent oxidoreductase YjgC